MNFLFLIIDKHEENLLPGQVEEKEGIVTLQQV
jgi:hypothetical protein